MTAHQDPPSSMDAVLENQDFAQEQQGLLELVDKIQFAQLDNVKLPQIVVVGDQSAGKSSVLEAITQLAFPRDAGACTRFATEIRLRRATEDDFSIRIRPSSERSYAERERLKQFGVNVDKSMSFETLMRLAVDLIAPKNIPGRFATKDVLVVEKKGPNMPLLTVVDLPGLVKNPNKDQSMDDIKAIEALTDRYMQSSRTIILAVVGGNQDYVQAPVLMKARHFDPTGSRTIGVLTKPDVTKEIGLEEKFIALVNNRDEHNCFDLGWYVLLNPGPREPGQEWPSARDRKIAEDSFFSAGRWATLPPAMCGATALKRKLSMQLQRHIGKHVRHLQKEIRQQYNNCCAELQLLGDGKDTIEEMREEVGQRLSDSKDLVTPGVDGSYKNPLGRSFFPRDLSRKGIPAQKLRARVVEENLRFAERVRMHGQKFQFASATASGAMNGMKSGSTSKQQHAREIVEPFIRQNKGVEFPGDHNPGIVYLLFQSHSDNWPRLAQEHKDKIGIICNEFLGEVIDEIWPNRMREPLRKEFLDLQMKSVLQQAQKEVDGLTKDLQLEIAPYDPEYEMRMNRWRSEASAENPHTEAEELLEKMLIYYELTAKTFISNVITQVVERHLLQGLRSIFSWLTFSKMTDDTVVAIAAENKATREKRLSLKAKKIAIADALDFCVNLASRKELRTYDRDETDDSDENASDEESSGSAGNEQHIRTPSTSNAARSSTSTTTKPHQPTPQEERPQRRPIKTNDVSTPVSTKRFDTSDFDSTARESDFSPFVSNAPQYAPPSPPPRPRKVPDYDINQPYSPSAPPESTGHHTAPSMPGGFATPAGRVEANGYLYSPPTSTARLNLNLDPGYPDMQSKKSRSKIFGSRG